MTAETIGFIGNIAKSVGASEPALRLLISVLLGYPLAFIYRLFVYDKDKLINNAFIAISGMGIVAFNYGYDIYHSLIAIFVTYLLTSVLKGRVLVISSFVFNMGYLLIGYYFTATDTYDIKWTMPHCVLTLRLIGLSFDVSDGHYPDDQLSTENKKSCIRRPLTPIEILAYALFPASLLVGPQFPFRRYESFVNKEFGRHTGNIRAGLARGGIGLMYLMVHQIGYAILPDDYFLSDEYAAHNILIKMIYMGLWGKLVLYKYISCWLLSEGAATCFGLTFLGVNSNGQEDWSGCSNIKLMLFENAEKYQHFVTAFNVNTNHWIAEYIYKRLKFLGNRTLSHAAALIFLAIWHGFHSGYYMCFLMEFIIIHTEKQVLSVFQKNEDFMKIVQTPIMKAILFVLLKFYTLTGMGFCLVPFVHLSYVKWWYIYKTVYCFGFVVFFPGMIYSAILRQILPPTKPMKNE